uniref:TIP41-like protein n=1 Tax=Strigamia maritima TaxID=126957 RepID=T1J0R9_STRMM
MSAATATASETLTDLGSLRDFSYPPWKISVRKNHILKSNCSMPNLCPRGDEGGGDDKKLCTFCRYNTSLNLPSYPEMLFADNLLRIEHELGFGIEFQPLDALLLVNDKQDLIKVAVAKAWKEARANSEHITDVVKPFDWTFTTNYKGNLIGKNGKLEVSPTEQRIDLEKLKQTEKILFYDEIHLFEDELADHGASSCTIKIRVMPSGFFVLHRFYLRVDDVLIRINDTRLHYELGNDHLLREYSSRESFIEDLRVPSSMFLNPNEIWTHLTLKEESIEKLRFPT